LENIVRNGKTRFGEAGMAEGSGEQKLGCPPEQPLGAGAAGFG